LVAKVKEKTMVNKRFWLGMLAMVLVFGMTVAGCSTEDDSRPYPQSITISVRSSSWDSSSPTNGSVEIWFQTPVLSPTTNYTGTPAKAGVDDLQWLKANDISLEPYDTDSRTVSISSISKTGGDTETFVKLSLTRSAEPPGMFGNTATVSITLPSEFTLKYPDGVTWGNRTFSF
jgi:hypothetical protein